MAAVPGKDMPRVSAMQAIVLAVPMTAQVPAVTERRPSTCPISSESMPHYRAAYARTAAREFLIRLGGSRH
jgi:hypothetical protein